jgi:hypothetical protein
MRTPTIVVIVLALGVFAPGCYTQIHSNGWPAGAPADPPAAAKSKPSMSDAVRGEFIGTVRFDFDSETDAARTYSGDISFRFEDGMYKCEGDLIGERGRCRDLGDEMVFDPPLPLPVTERPHDWAVEGSSGVARFAVVRSEQGLRLTSRNDARHFSCEIVLHRLFGMR